MYKFNNMRKLLTLSVFALILIGAGCKKSTKKTTSPNIILILADDMGWMDCELYGSTYYETPNLSRLASEGMHFTNAYAASPLCSPTRASIMSGQHPARLRITAAITPINVPNPKALPPKANQYCGDMQNKDHLPLEVFTLAEAFKESGFKTAHIGKWHLAPSGKNWNSKDETFCAENQGFDFVIGGAHLPGPTDYYSPYLDTRSGRRIRNLTPGPEGEYLNERLAEESIKWIKSVKDSGSPFYLNFWHYAIHGPWIPKKDLMPKYQAKTDPRGLQSCPEVATMLESMDNSVGILLDWLDLPENKSLKENTVVLIVSDNGGIVHEVNVNGTRRTVTSNRPLRGGKANTYEGGSRVPWIVRWPKHIAAGAVCTTPVSTIDIYPTLLEISGLKPKAEKILDGKSIVPLLKGGMLAERPVFTDFPFRMGVLNASSSSVRLGDYKLIRFYWAGANAASHYYELYDLKQDPFEAINIAMYMPKKVTELDALITQHLNETDALVPIRNFNFSGNPRTPRSSAAKAALRPKSYKLPQSEIVVEKDKGSRMFQLLDQNGKPCKTAALVLEGGSWIQLKNLPDGQVELTWDRSLKKNEAKVLFGWCGGTTAHEMNDWTLDPFELMIR
jgi:arylsulfatase A-like enzyme